MRCVKVSVRVCARSMPEGGNAPDVRIRTTNPEICRHPWDGSFHNWTLIRQLCLLPVARLSCVPV